MVHLNTHEYRARIEKSQKVLGRTRTELKSNDEFVIDIITDHLCKYPIVRAEEIDDIVLDHTIQ